MFKITRRGPDGRKRFFPSPARRRGSLWPILPADSREWGERVEAPRSPSGLSASCGESARRSRGAGRPFRPPFWVASPMGEVEQKSKAVIIVEQGQAPVRSSQGQTLLAAPTHGASLSRRRNRRPPCLASSLVFCRRLLACFLARLQTTSSEWKTTNKEHKEIITKRTIHKQ